MIRHGENGFLAESPAEWARAVLELAQSPALRRRMGAAGRRRVERDYGVAAGAGRWLALLSRLDARRGAA